LTFVQPNIHYPVQSGLPLAFLLLSISVGHILTSHSFKIHINTIVHLPLFPPSIVLASEILTKFLWAYFLPVTRATLLAHLVFGRTYCVFRPPRHWVMVSRNFRRKGCLYIQKGRIVFETLSLLKVRPLLSAEMSVSIYRAT